MTEIPAEALTRACDYDRQHRPRDGGGWTRVPDHQILRLLDGLAEQGYAIVRAEDIYGVLGPKRGVSAYINAGRRLLDAVEQPAQPPGTLQDASEGGPGVSGRSDLSEASTGLSALRRAEEAEEALEAAQQALSRVIRYARALNESNPVTADRIAEAILGPGDYAEGAALAALTKEKPDA